VIFNADARNAIAALALVSFALYAPSFQNLITSPFRHFGQDEDAYQLQISASKFSHDLTRDVWVYTDRVAELLEQTAITDRLPELAAYGKEANEPVQFLGEDLPRCTTYAGDAAVHAYMADQLKQPPFGYAQDAQFFVADVATVIWMEGGFAPLKNGAPWYYSGTPGVEHADAIVIPLCPVSTASQRASLAALESAGLVLGKAIRDEVMIVYPIKR
jgi:hypothetical protein